MGIERFFYSLAKNKIIKSDGIITGIKNKFDTEHLYVDFNSIIYNIASEIENELNYLLYALILEEIDDRAKEICTKWNFHHKNIDMYKKFFTSELIDMFALKNIKKYITNITTNIINSESIKSIFIAIDGVPQMGKIMEQKKRRYTGYLLGKFKGKIYDENMENVSKERTIYETNKISYDRGKIISWTKFMKNVKELLSSDEFLKELKEINKNLTKYYLSHQDINGEGEKKIMEHILENKIKGNYTIFSPDADMIILGIIMNNSLNNESIFNILRFNQQTNVFDTVDINILCESIYEYAIVYAKLDKKKYNKTNIVNDITFIFTLFGNDFIPKMESIDVRNDIQMLLETYCNNLEYIDKNGTTKPRYLIFNNPDGQHRINFMNFYEIIKNIANVEDGLLIDTYMANKYKNYAYYKRELNTNKLFPTLSTYISSANNLFSDLRNGQNIGDIIRKYNDINFIKIFLVLEARMKNINDISENKIIHMFEDKIKKMINDAKDGKKIKGNMKLQLYENESIGSEFHVKNMRENLPHPKMTISEYDKNIYKLEKRLGEYEIKLNATNFDLGGVSIGTSIIGDYKMTVHSKLENIIDYYATFFNIGYKKEKIKTKNGEKNIIVFDESMDKLIEDYLSGLLWIFDNYFNKNNSNLNMVSTWFYKHHRVPLLYQVREYLYKLINKGSDVYIKKMAQLYTDVAFNKKYFVEKNKFMTTLEQYIYVTPKNKQKDIPSNYAKIINDDNNNFPDMDVIASKIWNGTNNSDLIESKRISYFSKCNLKGINFMDYDEFIKNYIDLRKNNIIHIDKTFVKSY